MHRALTILLVVHGLIHGLGVMKAFQLGTVERLVLPITRPLGVLWLLAGLLLVASALVPWRWFWLVGILAVVLSQLAIATSWSDAKFGTVANVALLLAAAYSFASAGPLSLAEAYARDRAALLAQRPAPVLLTEADLQALPTLLQRYLRVTGSVGQPRVYNFRARWRGRMRGSASDAWMPIAAEQLNTLGADSGRLFSMTAAMRHLPVDIYHRFTGEAATFRVRVLSMLPVVDAKGAELTRAETVTILNDMCLLAPAALIAPELQWREVDAHTLAVTYTRRAQTVRAELSFDDEGKLVDFISDDRLRAAPDGKSFTRQRWSTPCDRYRDFAGRRVSSHGRARWHAPEGTFDYADFDLEGIEYNVALSPAESQNSVQSLLVAEGEAGGR